MVREIVRGRLSARTAGRESIKCLFLIRRSPLPGFRARACLCLLLSLSDLFVSDLFISILFISILFISILFISILFISIL